MTGWVGKFKKKISRAIIKTKGDLYFRHDYTTHVAANKRTFMEVQLEDNTFMNFVRVFA